MEVLYPNTGTDKIHIQPFGELIFPYHKMGTVDSLNLFDLDELIIFSFYWKNRNRYKKVLDIGANLGLHSILIKKCGYEVSCYEPDPTHFNVLEKNFNLNNITDINKFNKAVSSKSGEMEFVRVLGNTTGSHLAGSKANPYGELEKFFVEVVEIRSLLKDVDLVKMDVEGHEKEVLLCTKTDDWTNTDALIEIENTNNAQAIYKHFRGMELRLFAQKINWKEVKKVEDMPTSYREGTLFVSCKKEMPW
ncbi:MAG: FkbM family methyltransferase [Bacillota bacterium]|nr:FkbM family methyltransferase [Bacillota bacterium]